MKKFDGFSDAARHYAANEAVVNELYDRLKADADAFWGSVRHELAARLRLGVDLYLAKEDAKYAYLNVKDATEIVGIVWVERDDGRLVRESTLRVGFSLPTGKSASLPEAVKASGLLADVAGIEFLKTPKPSASTLFHFNLKLGAQPSVEAFADVVTPVLERLIEIAKAPTS